ncbi:putative ORFan [Tupanvirus deep ocean]|uniref:ORFan n=2 Tax=Tupanvirus TaxID=2094720 RepID=A0AC62A8P0_9VIRU|nr:putative ORFan [Tupanvirus deep ocean]QKU34112.1 putative ORFan [Tupanvirus deep ocean]
MNRYNKTRKIEKERLNKIFTKHLIPLIPKEIDKNKLTILFSINGYDNPYQSKIIFYYDAPLNLPKIIDDVDIIQIYEIVCRSCFSMAYPRCFCGNIKN